MRGRPLNDESRSSLVFMSHEPRGRVGKQRLQRGKLERYFELPVKGEERKGEVMGEAMNFSPGLEL